MPDGRRRSREGWADSMEAEPPAAPAHVHRLPRAVRVALIGLCAAVMLLAVALGLIAIYVYQANQYVQGRGEFRDREAQRLEQQADESVRRGMCDLLDQLPEDFFLDRPREKYGCGPGIPLDQLSPEEQAQLNGSPRPSVGSSPAVQSPPPPVGTPAVPSPPRAPSASPPPSGETPVAPSIPTAEPAPQPDGLLDPVTDPLCQALSICF